MNIKTLKTFRGVEPYLDNVRSHSDQNRDALGFLTRSAYLEKAWAGRLWVAVCGQTEKFLGFLLFGGTYPSIKVFQLFVCPSHRKAGIASKLVNELVEFGEANSYLTITARVAADLPSNNFWERAGFDLVRQEPGGRVARRTINIRVRELDTPSLLAGFEPVRSHPSTGIQDLYFRRGPLLRSPGYVLDLNVFFDIVKKRTHHEEATTLVQAGLNHEIHVRVTPEFAAELERHSQPGQPDPILELAKGLPTLPRLQHNELDRLVPQIKAMVFPHRSSEGKRAQNTQSDMVHLAYCIHHGITGFVTRENAILKASDKLRQAFSLEILCPADLAQVGESPIIAFKKVNASCDQKILSVALAREKERDEVEQFLTTIGVEKDVMSSVWDPGSSGSIRKRTTIRIGDRMMGIASWDAMGSFKRDTNLHLYVDERNPDIEIDRVIDHVLESVQRDSGPFESRRIFLNSTPEQTRTRTTALKRGFVRLFESGDSDSPTNLTKFTFRGLVNTDNWSEFGFDFQRLTGWVLPEKIPALEEFRNTGLVVREAEGSRQHILKLFDFETLVSPAIVLPPKRTGLIVPIQARYAKDLLVRIQEELFPSVEAILHVEKAYFHSSRNVKRFEKGLLILFYESGTGSGSKEIIGCARVTSSEVLPVDAVDFSLRRQGVLSRDELSKIADKYNNIHAFTFDNFNDFPHRIPFRFLRDNEIISKTNLVSVESVTSDSLLRLCRCGYGLEEIK